jgi:predicted RNA-binding protein
MPGQVLQSAQELATMPMTSVPGRQKPHQFHQGAKRMCDINVFMVKDGIEEKVLENVDLVEAVAEGVRLVNIFGEERTINGKMVRFDNSQKRMIFQS